MTNLSLSDLSRHTVRLDFEALEKTAQYAVSELMESVWTYHNKLRDEICERKPVPYLTAEYLANASKRLAIAVDTLYAIRESRDRKHLEIINRPAVKVVVDAEGDEI